MVNRQLVYIYLLKVPSFSSRYFNKIKRTSRLGRLLAFYFFHCNNYRNERHLFFEAARDFQPLTTQLLLYGNEIVDNTLNSTLFRAVQDYIKSTKRFDNT